MSMSR